MDTSKIKIVVVGSVNLDLSATVEKLPVAGETITGAIVNRYPGGKGANQALAARRLGADVSLVACVGDDPNADDALSLVDEGGVDLSCCQRLAGEQTGIAWICVAADGENQIVVAPGANRKVSADTMTIPTGDALICQLEIPVDTLLAVAEQFVGLFCINLAPAQDVPRALLERADLIVVNETEAAFYGDGLLALDAIIVTTLGAEGAVARQSGKEIARTAAPEVIAVDTTGAGDTFTAALVVALCADQELLDALEFACRAGSLATTKAGAQPSLPFLADLK